MSPWATHESHRAEPLPCTFESTDRAVGISVDYANQRSYLDDLFHIYPTIPEGIREIDGQIWEKVQTAFDARDNEGLLRTLISLDLFPIKNSYVAYLKRDHDAISRNPATVNRLCGRLYDMGIEEIYRRCS